jgi:hypothetical protein
MSPVIFNVYVDDLSKLLGAFVFIITDSNADN